VGTSPIEHLDNKRTELVEMLRAQFDAAAEAVRVLSCIAAQG
jgi:hypothetical protein